MNMKSLNVTGDDLSCQVQVLPKDGSLSAIGAKEGLTNMARGLKTQGQTKGLKTLFPEWNEEFVLTGWREGDPLAFTIYDKGAIASKSEGTAKLNSDQFYPGDFDSYLSFSDAPGEQCRLYVQVSYVGETKQQ